MPDASKHADAAPDSLKEGTVYLNGRFVPRADAKIDIEDRAVMFADGVYEVVRYFQGKPFAMVEHLDRLRESLEGIDISMPAEAARLDTVSDELVQRNGLRDARVYWQVSRGVAVREHAAPTAIEPTVFALAYPGTPLERATLPASIRVVLLEDIRWHRCSIKSVMLLPNVLARSEAARRGAAEAVLHRDGVITEGSATSVMIVRDGELWTHPTDGAILGSVTRAKVLALARGLGIAVHEEPFSIDALMQADEAMICSTTSNVTPISHVNDTAIGCATAQTEGRDASASATGVGPLAARLHDALVSHIVQQCGIASQPLS